MKKLNELPHLSTLIHQFKLLEKEPLHIPGVGDVTSSELHLLTEIGADAHLTAKKLSQRLIITKGGISQLSHGLEAKGLLQKLPSHTDKRVVHLSLTQQGQLVYATHLATQQAFLTALTDTLDDAELTAFIRGLAILTAFNEDLIQQRKEPLDER